MLLLDMLLCLSYQFHNLCFCRLFVTFILFCASSSARKPPLSHTHLSFALFKLDQLDLFWIIYHVQDCICFISKMLFCVSMSISKRFACLSFLPGLMVLGSLLGV